MTTAAERSSPQIRELDLKGLLARLVAGLRRVFANEKPPELQSVCVAKVSHASEGYRPDPILRNLPMIDDLLRNVGAVVFRKKEVATEVAREAGVSLFSFEVNSGTFYVLGRKLNIVIMLNSLKTRREGQYKLLLNMVADRTLLDNSVQTISWENPQLTQIPEERRTSLQQWLDLAS